VTIIEIKDELKEEEKEKLKELIFLVFGVEKIEIFSKEEFIRNSGLKPKIYQSYITDLIDEYEANLKD